MANCNMAANAHPEFLLMVQIFENFDGFYYSYLITSFQINSEEDSLDLSLSTITIVHLQMTKRRRESDTSIT